VNLESLEFYAALSEEDLEEIWHFSPRLKSLSIRGPAQGFVNVMKKFGGNLEYCRFVSSQSSLINKELIKNELKGHQFDVIFDGYEITAKKKVSDYQHTFHSN
jgi:hypothetical protein